MSDPRSEVAAHSPQCVTIGGGPGHDRCICYCHTTLGTTVTVTKDQLVDALMANDDVDLTGFRWSDAVFDDLLTATGHDYATAAILDRPAPPSEGLDAWKALRTEVEAFEAWYLPTRMGVNAWVGVDTGSGAFYGGWSVEGDPLTDDWDESEMTTAEGDTPAAVIEHLIRIARSYRERRDAERAEWAADDVAALTPADPSAE